MNKKEEVIRISKKLGLTHIGSCLSVLPALEDIDNNSHPEDKVILSGAHAHLSHLLFTRPDDAEELIQKDIHCNRDAGCDACGGSLGHGVGIGIGYAVANRQQNVHVVITDGSFHEGSEMEALRIAKTLNLKNLKVHANFNGFSAVDTINIDYLEGIIKAIGFPVKIHRTDNGLPQLDGVKGHYIPL
jgi:transketolase